MSRWNLILIVFQPLSVHKQKNIKPYLIDITWDCLVDFKGRDKYVVPALEAELSYLYRCLRSQYIIIRFFKPRYWFNKKSADFPFIAKYQCQFVAALEDAELLCTVVLDTGTGTIILPQAPLQI